MTMIWWWRRWCIP